MRSLASSRHVRLFPSLLVAFFAMAGGCAPRALTDRERPPEPETPPFTITNLHAEDRVVSFDLAYAPTLDLAAYEPVGLLVVYCRKPDFDVRLIGQWRGGDVWGLDDDLLGVEQLFATIWNGPGEFLGAWWHVASEQVDWTQRDHVRLRLRHLKKSGHIEGSGYMIAAIVSGSVGGRHEPFVLLSEPVSTPYVHRPAAPVAAGADAGDDAS